MNLKEMNLQQLKKYAKEHHIKGYSKLKKSELIDLIGGKALKTKEKSTKREASLSPEIEEFKLAYKSDLAYKHWLDKIDDDFINKTKKNYSETYKDKSGFIRWKSSDHIPPKEVLSSFVKIKLISLNDALNSWEQSKRDDAEFIMKIRKATPKQWKESEENLAEMRANFDEDEELVDVIRGAKINLKTGIWTKIGNSKSK